MTENNTNCTQAEIQLLKWKFMAWKAVAVRGNKIVKPKK